MQNRRFREPSPKFEFIRQAIVAGYLRNWLRFKSKNIKYSLYFTSTNKFK